MNMADSSSTPRPQKKFDVLKVIESYKPLTAAPYVTDKTAHFLDWAAKAMPYVAIPYGIIVRARDGLTRTPSPTSEAVQQLAKSMGRVGEKLIKQYNRTHHVMRGVGVRASVDEADKARTSHAKAVDKHHATGLKVIKSAQTIDVTKIRDPKLASFVTKSAQLVTDTTSQVNRLLNLLPPKEDKKVEKKDE